MTLRILNTYFLPIAKQQRNLRRVVGSMRIIRTTDFDRALARLPANIRSLAEKQLTIFEEHERDSRLRIKKLHAPYTGIFTFRITRTYREFFYADVDGNAIVFDVDHRKDSYR